MRCVHSRVSNPDISTKLENPCAKAKDRCVNCHSYFMNVRPFVKSVVISNHFVRDLKDEKEVQSIVNDILDCSNMEFVELHKFEANVEGNLVFRAKKNGLHLVYCVDKKMRIVFLRAFRNYGEYGKFLADKKEIRRMISHA